ncbi:MAG: ferritin-like domain-containing protein [Solirubrobacteraceae bacterium]
MAGASAGVAAAGAVGVGAGAGVGSAGAATPTAQAESDAKRLHRLLSVELLLLFCYQHVLASSVLTPRAQRGLTPLRTHEEAHVRVLRARLAVLGTPAPQPPAGVAAADRALAHRRVKGRLGQLQSSRDAVHLVLDLERVTLGAYFVALTKLDDPGLITLGAQIMAGEAQHEAMIGELLYPGSAQKAVPYAIVQGVQ